MIKLPKYFTKDDVSVVGVYFLIRNNKIVYIGKSTSVITRVFISNIMVQGKFDYVRLIPCSKEVLMYYEKRWIIRFRPKYNHEYLFTWRGKHFGNRQWVPINHPPVKKDYLIRIEEKKKELI